MNGRRDAKVPQLKSPDSTISLLREGYPFLQTRARELGSNVFEGRILGQKTLFISGHLAAELFHDETLLQRAGALPRTMKQRFVVGGSPELDDRAHRDRKRLFTSIMTRTRIGELVRQIEEAWQARVSGWPERTRVVLFAEAAQVLCRAACNWAGVPLSTNERLELTSNCVHMVDGFASVGARSWRARSARKRAEAWARSVIERIRTQELAPPVNCAARVIAEHEQSDGSPLPLEVAAAELLNVIRPTVAMAWWVAFAGLALHDHPRYMRRLVEDEAFVVPFVREVRRFYPFTPYLAARARVDFEWEGAKIRKGQMVVFNVYGSLRDAKRWDTPELFLPERFSAGQTGLFEFVSQGSGEVMVGHQCAGELLATEALAVAVRVLVERVTYDVPKQDLGYSLSRIPTSPRSGVVLANVKLTSVSQLTSVSRRPMQAPSVQDYPSAAAVPLTYQ